MRTKFYFVNTPHTKNNKANILLLACNLITFQLHNKLDNNVKKALGDKGNLCALLTTVKLF